MQSTAVSIYHLPALFFKAKAWNEKYFHMKKSVNIIYILLFSSARIKILLFSLCLSVFVRSAGIDIMPNDIWIGLLSLLRMDQVCVMWPSRGLDRRAVGWTVGSFLAFRPERPEASFQRTENSKLETQHLKSAASVLFVPLKPKKVKFFHKSLFVFLF